MMYVLTPQTGADQRIITQSLYLTPTIHPMTGGAMQSIICYDHHDIQQGILYLSRKYPNTPILISKVRFQSTPSGDPTFQYQEHSDDGDLLPVKLSDLKF